MHRRIIVGCDAVFRTVGFVLAVVGPGLTAGDAAAQDAPRFEIRDLGVMPRPSREEVLLGMDAVRQDLKFSEAQAKDRDAIMQRRFQTMQEARRDIKDRVKLQEAMDANFQEQDAALRSSLKPEQQVRLDQIQLRAQGPLAFGPSNFTAAYAGAPLVKRLELSDDQVRRVRVIVREGLEEIEKVASFPITIGSKEKPPSEDAIRVYVDGQEFRAERQRASQAGREVWVAVIRRIEEVLTPAQRDSYGKLLGDPFDLARLQFEEQEQDRPFEIQMVGRAFGAGGGGGGGQLADPNFDTKVARPAYPDLNNHPRVLFDEAHYNFHTTTGRYRPFGQLIGNDGYRVLPNLEKFSAELLRKGDILVIANALGAEGMGEPGASDPAFTDAECDAVRDWVRDGGGLLFITDHAPMGSAAECLAKRFGIDLSKGATSDPVNSEGGESSLVFSRQNRLLGDHPITSGRDASERVNRVQTFSGTSMKGPEGSIPILKLAETAFDNPDTDDGKAVSAAGRAQGIALSFGKGRVVMLGEAAELSAQVVGDEKFGMNVPGLDNRQMALNIMHWLSGLLEPKRTQIDRPDFGPRRRPSPR